MLHLSEVRAGMGGAAALHMQHLPVQGRVACGAFSRPHRSAVLQDIGERQRRPASQPGAAQALWQQLDFFLASGAASVTLMAVPLLGAC